MAEITPGNVHTLPSLASCPFPRGTQSLIKYKIWVKWTDNNQY